MNKKSFRVWQLGILQQKTKHYTKNSTKRYVMLYIRFGFERNGVGRGGDLHQYKTPQYPLLNSIPHTIIHLLQKKQKNTYCFIYLYLVLQTLPSYLSNKKTASIAQKNAIFSTVSTITWHYVLQKKYVLNKKNLRSPILSYSHYHPIPTTT